jgi:predicted DNA-binding transcriptional regulator AlpA
MVTKTRKKKPAANLIGQGNRQLKGMLDICKYVGFSESTILHWIRNDNFPAKKTTEPGGIWVSTTSKVDKWREIFFA